MFHTLVDAIRQWRQASVQALHPPRPERRRHALLIPALMIVAMFVTYLTTRLYATYATATVVKVNQQQIEVLMTELQAERARSKANYDELFRTLYRAMVDAQEAKAAAEAPRRPPRVTDAWQVNRDREINNRLSALEAWRYRVDR